MDEMSDNVKKVFTFIIKYQSENGYSPSIPEIMKGTGIGSIRGVSLQLDKLQEKGYIRRDKQARRAIKILASPIPDQEITIKVPLVGEIRAGYPALAEENIEGYRDISKSEACGRSDVFLLRVKGDSMTRAGINPNDIVVIAPQPVADNGDIVVALNPGENTATLKRFKKMNGYVILFPESTNPKYKPIIERDVMIQGKVIGILPK